MAATQILKFGLIAAVVTICAGNVPSSVPPYEVYYEWKTVDFEFPNEAMKENLLKEKKLIPRNLVIVAHKFYKNRLFLTTPRYKADRGVPIVLSVVPYDANVVGGGIPNKSPKLKPFPNCDMQEEGNCSAIQNTHSMEVDPYGRLWVLDVGRTALYADKITDRCPAKLLVFDLENGDKHLCTYTFPADVISPTANIIKDFSIACHSKDDCWVFISDLGQSRIAVYSNKLKESWTASHPLMKPDMSMANYTVGGTPVTNPFGVTGQALSPKSENYARLYFTLSAGDHMYAVETQTLKNPKLKENNQLKESDVMDLGKITGPSDGVAMDNQGNFYYGDLVACAVYKVKLNQSSTKVENPERIAQNDKELIWTDAFSFDNQGHLFLSVSRFHQYMESLLGPDEVNFRLIRFKTGTNGGASD